MKKLFLFFLFCIFFAAFLYNLKNVFGKDVAMNKNLKTEYYSSLGKFFSADNKKIKYIGRIDFSNPKIPVFDWPGISIKVKFIGSPSCSFVLDDGGNNYEVIIDGKVSKVLVTKSNKEVYNVAENLSSGEHLVEIYKRTEASYGIAKFKGVILSENAKLLPVKSQKLKIEFIGDSITCGYGNESSSVNCKSLRKYENNYMAFSGITARKLNAEAHIIAVSGRGIVHNYGDKEMISKGTVPDYYDYILQNKKKRWDFKNWQPDIIVIGLGANDFSTGNIPTDDIFIRYYKKFVKKVRKNNPSASIVCLVTRRNKKRLLNNIKRIVKDLTKNDKNVYFFALPEFSPVKLGCDYHPNVDEHKRVSKSLIRFLRKFNY